MKSDENRKRRQTPAGKRKDPYFKELHELEEQKLESGVVNKPSVQTVAEIFKALGVSTEK